MYPTSSKSPQGKLRLLYECNPIAFLAEQSGGKATDGYRRIMEIKPKELHERVPIFCGSRLMVDKLEEFMAKYPTAPITKLLIFTEILYPWVLLK